MDNFFARVTERSWPWPAGREDYHWHILPDPRLVRDRLMAPYREITHHPGLAPVAPEWAHITVLHSAPVPEVTGPEITAITARVRAACADIAPFTLTVDRPAVGTVAVELPAWPGAPARRLWELTAAATREVIGNRYPVLPALYYPHLTLSYAGPEAHLADRTDLKVRLSDLPDAGPVQIPVDCLALVAQSHDGRRQITWRTILTVPLTGQTGTKPEEA